jgi:hypothetical protein
MTQKPDHPHRCLYDYFNPDSHVLCKNWDKFYGGCKLLFYKQNKEWFQPKINHEKRWILQQVGCASFEAVE